MTKIQGGSAKKIVEVSGNIQRVAGAAIPVFVVSGRKIHAGESMRGILVDAAYVADRGLRAGAAIPIILVADDGSIGGAALPLRRVDI